MSLCLCCTPVRTSTRNLLCFPWILSNPNGKVYPMSLAVNQSNKRPRLFAQEGGDFVVLPEVKARKNVVEEHANTVSDGFAASDSGFEDKATQKTSADEAYDETFKLRNGKKVYTKNEALNNTRISAESRHRISDSHLDNHRSLKEAVDALESFAERGSKVSPHTYIKLLQSCADLNCIELGRKLHASMSVVENVDPFVETKLVSMYAKCGCLLDARRVFDGMPDRNLFTWSAMIQPYSRAQKWEHVLDLFLLMVRDGVMPNRFLFPKILKACGKCRDLAVTKVIHSMVVRLGFCGSIRVSNSILSVYAKSGKLNWARRFFNQMEKRDTVTWNAIIMVFFQEGLTEEAMKVMKKMESLGIAPDVVTWNSMISGLSHSSCGHQALDLFNAMLSEGLQPNAITIRSVVSACASLVEGKEIHAFSIKIGVMDDVYVGNSLIDMYCKCGDLESARQVFDKMIDRNVCTWTSLIEGYCQAGYNGKACDLVMKMQESGVEPDVFTWNVIIMGFFQEGLIEKAIEVRKEMESLGIAPDVVTWNSMISGLSHTNRSHQALDMFKEMLLQGIESNAVTITSVVSACASLVEGKEIHAFSVKIGVMDDVYVGNSLIDMYCKCGDLESAQQVFDKMIERNVCTWNSLIGGYCQAGYNGKACELVMKVQESGVEPDVITWNVMVSGYMRNGHEDLAMDLFQRMEKDGKIKRDTASWNALMAGYLKLGEKDKAFWIFRQMQLNSVVPDIATVLTVLPAFGNLLAAKNVREMHCCILRRSLESRLPVVSSLVDTYAKSGNLRYSKILFDMMQSKDTITWNSIISGYVSHGFPDIAIDMYDHMRKSQRKPSGGTFLPVIYAYGLSGRVDDGKEAFSSMVEDYHIVPSPEHYSAMVELLGRAGRLGEAVELIANMPVEPNLSVWSALLTASRIHKNVSLAVRALDNMIALEPWNHLVQRLRTQISGLVGKPKPDFKMREAEKENDTVMRQLGRCWIELANKVYTFHAGDQSHPYLYPWIHKVTRRETTQSGFHEGHYIEEQYIEDVSGVHSEKLALGFALITFPGKSQSIRIVKNLRMCEKCHETVKYVSKLYGREIFVNDSKRLHRFSDGQCSCRDYW